VGNLKLCSVSFLDSNGIKHTAEVTAESLFEAAVLGIAAISQEWAEEPALMTSIQVEAVSPAVRHEVTVKQIRQWLNSNCTSPRERVMKERLKGLIA
jgi:hypothetical protein